MSCKPAFAAAAAALLALLPASSCHRNEAPPVRRVAILPFEDHSAADGAWLARLVPYSLRRQMESVPLLQLAEVRSLADFPDATHELSGFIVSRRGRVEAHLFLYALPGHGLLRQTVVAAPETAWRDLLGQCAAFLSSALHAPGRLNPVSVQTESAARKLADAIHAPSPSEALPAFREASASDPACGWCWLGWAETSALVEGPQAALAVLYAVLKRSESFDPPTRARLELLEANLRHDRLAAASALERIAAAAPSDPLVQLRLSEALVASRDYPRAESTLRNALTLAPALPPLWNSLAYALAHQGRYDQALEAIRRYEELDAGPNPADSRGEILMMAGRFREAAAAFEQSYQKDPAFNGGAAMEKAALCWLLEGDMDRASGAVSRFVQDRAFRSDRMAELHQARWELLLGQPQASASRLARLARNQADPLSALAGAMLALRLSVSDPAAAASWLARGASRDPALEHYRTYAAAAIDPSSVEKVRDQRLRLELRALSLTVRREWNRAAEAWRQVIEGSPGGTDSPFRELRAFCLVQAGEAAQAAQGIHNVWPLLSQGQMLFYDFLVYPALLYTRAETALAAGRKEDARRLYDIFLRFAASRVDLAQPAARARSAARL